MTQKRVYEYNVSIHVAKSARLPNCIQLHMQITCIHNSKIVFFSLSEPTVFTTTLPSELTVSTGKGFALQCAATHSADTTVVLTWSRDTVALTNGSNISLTSSLDSTSISLGLNVVQTTLADAGTYSCSAITTYTAGGKSIATTPIAPITTPITITITGRTNFIDSKLLFTLTNNHTISLQILREWTKYQQTLFIIIRILL